MRLLPLPALPLLLLLLLLLLLVSGVVAVERITTHTPLGPGEVKRWHVPCSAQYAEHGLVEGCHPTDCRRVINDGFVSREEVERLKAVADLAMEGQGSSMGGGPCIADINSGACVWWRGL
jgi:hypothetical protein